jgi:hypothetical protein
MIRNLNDPLQQTDRQHVRLAGRLHGVLDEEEYFARQEVERRQNSAEERQAGLVAIQREREREPSTL